MQHLAYFAMCTVMFECMCASNIFKSANLALYPFYTPENHSASLSVKSTAQILYTVNSINGTIINGIMNSTIIIYYYSLFV